MWRGVDEGDFAACSVNFVAVDVGNVDEIDEGVGQSVEDSGEDEDIENKEQ